VDSCLGFCCFVLRLKNLTVLVVFLPQHSLCASQKLKTQTHEFSTLTFTVLRLKNWWHLWFFYRSIHVCVSKKLKPKHMNFLPRHSLFCVSKTDGTCKFSTAALTVLHLKNLMALAVFLPWHSPYCVSKTDGTCDFTTATFTVLRTLMMH